MTDRVFVGNGRKALVRGIIDRVDKLTSPLGESKSCWISLEAPSGWGKTRVLHEVYRELSKRQKSDGIEPYWPASIIPESVTDTLSRRKRVVPPFQGRQRNPEMLPEFFWWGLSCDMRSTNEISYTLIQDVDQIDFHGPFLEAAWSAEQLLGTERFATRANARKAIAKLLEQLTTEGLTQVSKVLLDANFPGMGLMTALGKLGYNKANKSRETAAKMKVRYDNHEGRDFDIVSVIVELLGRLATPNFPVIIAVEDIHKASPPVLNLLQGLLDHNAPIIILSTTWPDMFEGIEGMEAVLENTWLSKRLIRMRHSEATPPGLPTSASLAELSVADFVDIILSKFPDADPTTITRLSTRYNNPLPLELVLNLDAVKEDHPKLEMSSKQIASLPDSVRDIYNTLWNELPKPVQRTLALVTIAMPHNQPEWLASLVAEAIRKTEAVKDGNTISTILLEDNIPHGWSRIIEESLHRFGEIDQLTIAKSRSDEYFSANIRNSFINNLYKTLREVNFDVEVESKNLRHMAWLVITLNETQKFDPITLNNAVVFLLVQLHDQPLDLQTRITLGKKLVRPDNILSLEVDTYLTGMSFYGAALVLSGRFQESIQIYEFLLEAITIIHGPNHPGTLGVQNDLAHCTGESGDIPGAVKQLRALLDLHMQTQGSDHPDTLRVQSNLAQWLARSGNDPDAINLFQTLLENQLRILGADSVYTLNTRHNLISCLARSNKVSAATKQFKKLVEDQTRILGPEDTNTLNTRNTFANFVGRTGNISEAVKMLTSVLDDQTKVLGKEHYRTLNTRNNRAIWIAKTGDLSLIITAIQELESVLEIQTRTLSPNYLGTLTTRHNLAVRYISCSMYAEAIEQLEILFECQKRLLGPKHSDTLQTKEDLSLAKSQVSKANSNFE